jgi:hypothetical protein
MPEGNEPWIFFYMNYATVSSYILKMSVELFYSTSERNSSLDSRHDTTYNFFFFFFLHISRSSACSSFDLT